jgi:hypothetical protein
MINIFFLFLKFTTIFHNVHYFFFQKMYELFLNSSIFFLTFTFSINFMQ